MMFDLQVPGVHIRSSPTGPHVETFAGAVIGKRAGSIRPWNGVKLFTDQVELVGNTQDRMGAWPC